MSNALDALMTVLDPREMAAKIDRPHDDALYAYRGKQGVPGSFQEFRAMLKEYYEYHYRTAISKGYSAPEEVSVGAAIQAVESAFGNRGGLEGAYQTAIIGMDRGLHSSFEAIAQFLKETHRKWYVRWAIDEHVDPFDFDQRVALVRALLKTYPSPGNSYGQKQPEELAANHYALVAELARRLRSYIPTYYRARAE